MSDHTSKAPELPIWFNVIVYILLLTALVVFGDLLTFVVGFLAVTISFVYYFNSRGGDH